MHLIPIIFSAIFVQPIFSEQCFIPGKYLNDIGHYYTEKVTSVEDCLDLCNKGICKWSTFNTQNGFCELFSEIKEIDYKKCPLCLNNERDCVSREYNQNPDVCKGKG